jgi:hypothetical protein
MHELLSRGYLFDYLFSIVGKKAEEIREKERKKLRIISPRSVMSLYGWLRAVLPCSSTTFIPFL